MSTPNKIKYKGATYVRAEGGSLLDDLGEAVRSFLRGHGYNLNRTIPLEDGAERLEFYRPEGEGELIVDLRIPGPLPTR